jgi:soluble lytic murein transglycosylase-like protein
MKYLIVLLIFIAGWFATEPAESMENPHIAYVEHFLRLYPKRLENARTVLPIVESTAVKHGFDPLIPAVIISCESAWKSGASGSVGELGLMQVHGRCARKQDLSTPKGQIAAGMACLAMARDACDGSLTQTITMYMSGSCRARTERTKRVVARRVRIIERWR